MFKSNLIACDKEYVMGNYAPYDVIFTKGEGCYLYDTEGKKYVDFLAGIAVCSLGHNSPVVVKALSEQAKNLAVSSNYFYNEFRGPLAKALMENTNLGKAFFCSSGAEANECALKLVRKFFYENGSHGNKEFNQDNKKSACSHRYKIVSLIDSFHGRTLATVSLTGQEKYNLPYSPLPAGLNTYIAPNDITALEQALSNNEVGAFIIELIQGESGVYPLSKEYVQKARELTTKNGQLLIVDEVQTGGGRTGKFWGFEHFGIKPDIVTVAKGIGGGFPIGVCMATNEVASAFKPGDHGTTFGGSPLACRVALDVVNTIKEEKFLQNVEKMGDYLKNALNSIGSPILEVRGKGLMLGAVLDKKIDAKAVFKAMLDKGFVINACGNNVLRFLPALIVTKNQIDLLINALKEVLYG